MPPFSAYKIVGAFVARSFALCGLHGVGLRASLGRASAATIFSLASFSGAMANATVKRISSIYKDLGQSQKIYLHAGLISVVEFPRNILEVRLGNPSSLKAQISQVSPKELTLYLGRQNVEPTNLIVKSQKRIYVFDIIPSRLSHQDYIKISGAFSGPEFQSSIKPQEVRAFRPETQRSQPRIIESAKLGGR